MPRPSPLGLLRLQRRRVAASPGPTKAEEATAATAGAAAAAAVLPRAPPRAPRAHHGVRRGRRGGVAGGVRGGRAVAAAGRLPRGPLPARAVTRQARPARQLHREGGGEGAQGEVPHRQVRLPPDGPHPEETGRRDVALRRAAEAVRVHGEQQERRGGCRHR